MTLQDKIVQRENLLAEVRRQLAEYRANGRKYHLRNSIPLESRNIRQLKDVLRYWREQEQRLTQDDPEPQAPRADPEPIIAGLGVTEARKVAEDLKKEVNGETTNAN